MKKQHYGTKQSTCKHWYTSRRYYDQDRRYWICLDCGYMGKREDKEHAPKTA